MPEFIELHASPERQDVRLCLVNVDHISHVTVRNRGEEAVIELCMTGNVHPIAFPLAGNESFIERLTRKSAAECL